MKITAVIDTPIRMYNSPPSAHPTPSCKNFKIHCNSGYYVYKKDGFSLIIVHIMINYWVWVHLWKWTFVNCTILCVCLVNYFLPTCLIFIPHVLKQNFTYESLLVPNSHFQVLRFQEMSGRVYQICKQLVTPITSISLWFMV